MAIPTFVAVGTAAQTATNGGVGPVTPGLPAGLLPGHVLLLFVETANQSVNAIAGYSNVGVGTVAQATGVVTSLTVRWKVAVAGETAPGVSIAAGGNHVIAQLMAVSGCETSLSPIHVSNTGADNTITTPFNMIGCTTSVDDCLVVQAFSTGTDVTSTAMATWGSNASLSSPTERVDNWHVTGDGGGFSVLTGGKATRGAVSTTSVTLTTGNTKAMMAFALRPPVPSGDPFSYQSGMRGNGPMY